MMISIVDIVAILVEPVREVALMEIKEKFASGLMKGRRRNVQNLQSLHILGGSDETSDGGNARPLPLHRPHAMPDFSLSTQKRNALVTHILSLRQKPLRAATRSARGNASSRRARAEIFSDASR